MIGLVVVCWMSKCVHQDHSEVNIDPALTDLVNVNLVDQPR